MDRELCWAPHSITWRHVRPGDIVADVDAHGEPTGAVRLVVDIGAQDGQLIADVRAGGGWRWRGALDPDLPVAVLVPVPERDALGLAAAQLGARLISARSAA